MEPDEITGDRRGRHERDDVVRQADPQLEVSAVDDSPDCGGREPGGVAKTHEHVPHHDADARDPNHVEGHDAAQDRETTGCPRHGEQMGGSGVRVGAGLHGGHLGHDGDRHLESHYVPGAPGQHPPAHRQDQKILVGQREGGASC